MAKAKHKKSSFGTVTRTTGTTYVVPKPNRTTLSTILGAVGTVSDGVNQDTGGHLWTHFNTESGESYELIVTCMSENTVGIDVFISNSSSGGGTQIATIGNEVLTSPKDYVVNFNILSGNDIYLSFRDVNSGVGGEGSLTTIDKVSLIKTSTTGPGTCDLPGHGSITTCEGTGACSNSAFHNNESGCLADDPSNIWYPGGGTWTLDILTNTSMLDDPNFDFEYTTLEPFFGSFRNETRLAECVRLFDLNALGTPGALSDYIWDRIAPSNRLNTKAEYGVPVSACLIPDMWTGSGRFRYLNKNLIPTTIEEAYISQQDADSARYKNNECTPFHVDEDQTLPCWGVQNYYGWRKPTEDRILGITNAVTFGSTIGTSDSETKALVTENRITLTKPTAIGMYADLSSYNPYLTGTYAAPSGAPTMRYTIKGGYKTEADTLIVHDYNMYQYVSSVLASGNYRSEDMGAGIFKIDLSAGGSESYQGQSYWEGVYVGGEYSIQRPSSYNYLGADTLTHTVGTRECDGTTTLITSDRGEGFKSLHDIKMYGKGNFFRVGYFQPGTHIIEGRIWQHVRKSKVEKSYYHHATGITVKYSGPVGGKTIPVPLSFVEL
jgi:hypothetical protein